MIDPVSYLDMLLLECRARMISHRFRAACRRKRTSSGFRASRCATKPSGGDAARIGCNVLAGAETEAIVAAAAANGAGPWTADYGDGESGTAILNALESAQP